MYIDDIDKGTVPGAATDERMASMKETVRLWSQDHSELLFTTEDRDAAKAFFIASGQDWLPIVFDYGTDWQQRWGGRIELVDGEVTINQESEFLKYMTAWPNPFVQPL